ncbi:MAG: PAS domain S-box protein [Halofilum sp. (in: g-proteobacteria)]
MKDVASSNSARSDCGTGWELERRPCRQADFAAQSRVLAELAQSLLWPPEQQAQRAMVAVTELCQADAAGISRIGGPEAEVYRGHDADGATPQEIALSRQPTDLASRSGVILLDQPQRSCPELLSAYPCMVEALVAPFEIEGAPAGALWAISQREERRFDAEDARLLSTLAHFAANAEEARRQESTDQVPCGSDAMLRDLVENANEPIRCVGADGIIEWVNQAELDLLGYRRDEYVGQPAHRFHADPAAFNDILACLHRGEVVQDHPARLIAKDGSIREVAVTTSASWRDGELVHTRCFTRDVTENCTNLEAQARLAAIVESSHDAIVSKDLSGHIISWNSAAAQLFGYTASEAVGQPVTMLIPADRSDEEPEIMRRIRAGERVDHYETVRQAKDGRLREISLTVSPVLDREGRVIGASKIARDIGDRKRTERLLLATKAEAERQKRLYEAIMSGTPDLVWVVDRDYRFIFANESIRRMWGYAGDPCGKTLRELGYAPWRAEHREQTFAQVIATGTPMRGEATFPHAELGERIYDYIFLPVADAEGEVEVIAGVSRDVTEFKRVERELRESQSYLSDLTHSLEQRVSERTEALQRQTDRLRELAAELTTAEQRERKRLAALLHDELQQLLVAAQIRLNQALERVGEGKGGDALVGVQQLLDETMAASRNLTRQLRPPVLYEDGLVSALKGLAADIGERHLLAVTVEADESPPSLSDDLKALLFESVRELLLNVAKHAGVGEARVEIDRLDTRWRIAVSDVGSGFDPETGADEHRLAGFGLFSIRERLLAIGGDFRIETNAGAGTRVELAVPLKADDRGAARADSGTLRSPASGPALDEPQRTGVLIVDDHTMVRQGLAHVLGKHERIAVSGEAGDGIEAIEAIHRHAPDVVLMDVNMPRMNGIETTREIRRRWPGIAIIGLSVMDDDATAELMRQAGASGFVPKSGDAEHIISTLEALIDAREAGVD